MNSKQIVERIVEYVIELRLTELDDLKDHPDTLPPEILLLLAWEKSILNRYANEYEKMPELLRYAIDAAKLKCGDRADVLVGLRPSQAYVETILCKSCAQPTSFMNALMALGSAKPLWVHAYLSDGENDG